MEQNNTADRTEGREKRFSMEEWVRQKQAERDSAFRMIDTMADLARADGTQFRTCLDLMARFPRYSAGNLLLIAAQRPDATRLGDFEFWKEADANVKKGESGILILEPGKEYPGKDGTMKKSYNVKRVFDISQTNADWTERPKAQRDARQLLKALIAAAPCEILIDDAIGEGEAPARFEEKDGTVRVRRGGTTEELFAALAREIPKAKTDPADPAPAYAAYVLCRRMGIPIESFSFDPVPEAVAAMDAKAFRDFLKGIRDLSGRMEAELVRETEAEPEKKERDGAR